MWATEPWSWDQWTGAQRRMTQKELTERGGGSTGGISCWQASALATGTRSRNGHIGTQAKAVGGGAMDPLVTQSVLVPRQLKAVTPSTHRTPAVGFSECRVPDLPRLF